MESWSITMHSIDHGLWTDPNIWSTSTVPQDGDSIYVHHEVVYGGTNLILNNLYLEITVTGCLCGPNAEIVFHNSTLINDGHMAFIRCELHDNSVGTSGGTLLLTEYVLATSNSSMTITNGFIHITEENDLTCTCFDSTRYDSLMTLIDEDAIVNFNFQNYFNLDSDTMNLCNGESITLHYDDSVTYNWSNGSIENSIIPETNGWYTVNMTQKGDTIKDSIYVNILEKFDRIFPNVYSPNNDGVNDHISINPSFEVEFCLYNRWGKNLIYYKGKGLILGNLEITDGTYYYLLRVQNKCDPALVEQKGWVQVLR